MRVKFILSCLFLVLVGTHLLVQAQSVSKKPKTKTIFFDDFSGSSLDRSKWNVIITGFTVNNEQQTYVDSSATIQIAPGSSIKGAKNGTLVIKPAYVRGYVTPEGKKFDFISGRIDTRNKFDFTYGVASARIKMSEGSGLWPAFWALGYGKWPDCGEIDIMEYVGEPDWTSVALHGPGYSGETPLVNKYYFPTKFDATQWHVYSVAWTQQGFLFIVDDVLVYRATRAMVEHYGPWAFDNPKFLILNLALGGAYPFKTNGIEKLHQGITPSTFERIKAGKASFFIDWVRVVKISE